MAILNVLSKPMAYKYQHMLGKSTLKRLREHDLIELLRRDPNPSQTLGRLRSQVDRAIKESTLVAKKLPKRTHAQVFECTNVAELLKAILEGNPNDNSYDDIGNFDGNVIHIAAMLVREGVEYCVKQYTTKIEQNSRLNRPTIERLNEACQVCDAIAFRIYSPSIETAAKKENLTYLFNWNNISELNINDIELDGVTVGDDNKALISLLKEVISSKIGRGLGLTRQIKIEIEVGIKKCYIVTRFGKGYRIELEISKDEEILIITIFDEDYTSKLLSRNLIIKKKYGMYYVYDKSRHNLK
jgi:hypothetical protein